MLTRKWPTLLKNPFGSNEVETYGLAWETGIHATSMLSQKGGKQKPISLLWKVQKEIPLLPRKRSQGL